MKMDFAQFRKLFKIITWYTNLHIFFWDSSKQDIMCPKKGFLKQLISVCLHNNRGFKKKKIGRIPFQLFLLLETVDPVFSLI